MCHIGCSASIYAMDTIETAEDEFFGARLDALAA
jgi:hypothetical protein